MITLMGLFGLEMFPNLIWSNPNPAHSLTIYNAASSPKTLGIMLIIAVTGVPAVLAYTASIYWIFRGKVRLDRMSYAAASLLCGRTCIQPGWRRTCSRQRPAG